MAQLFISGFWLFSLNLVTKGFEPWREYRLLQQLLTMDTAKIHWWHI